MITYSGAGREYYVVEPVQGLHNGHKVFTITFSLILNVARRGALIISIVLINSFEQYHTKI